LRVEEREHGDAQRTSSIECVRISAAGVASEKPTVEYFLHIGKQVQHG
jgi:hypothetical protein